MFTLGWPQLILLALLAMEVGISLGKHGEPRPNHNAWIAILGAAIVVSILAWGGFWEGCSHG